ncbi:MAG: family 1 glycosylhydrolase [Acidimicrobiales bacterium]|nr:family 1 glycosylhydrolase [Acidimicrobiales bacterium]
MSGFPDFVVSCGEEASDPLVLHDGREVRVDELAASGHLDHLDEDLAAVAGLGVRVWRYGMPWRLTEPEPGVYDWTLWDRALAACERHGLTPVVDLCHFGLPDQYPGFCDPAWVDGFARYVDAFLARYPEPHLFTPVNEPMITAMFSGRLGFWNDRRTSAADYGRALSHVVLANLEAVARIDADRGGWWIGAEGFGCHVAVTDDDQPAADAARALEQLVWDLHLGVEPPTGLPAGGDVDRALDAIDPGVRARIDALAGPAHGRGRLVAGHDFYPVSVQVHGHRAEPLSITERVQAYDREARRWYERYRRPFWVAETSNLGLDVHDGSRWLAELTAVVDAQRADGLPARGICWYSRGDQFDWDTALLAPVGAVTEVGLFDAHRVARPVAADYAALAARHA